MQKNRSLQEKAVAYYKRAVKKQMQLEMLRGAIAAGGATPTPTSHRRASSSAHGGSHRHGSGDKGSRKGSSGATAPPSATGWPVSGNDKPPAVVFFDVLLLLMLLFLLLLRLLLLLLWLLLWSLLWLLLWSRLMH